MCVCVLFIVCTQSSCFKYCYLIILIKFYVNNWFAHCKMISNIVDF